MFLAPRQTDVYCRSCAHKRYQAEVLVRVTFKTPELDEIEADAFSADLERALMHVDGVYNATVVDWTTKGGSK